MIEGTILVCDALALEEGGKGVRFPVTAGGEDATGFVVRYHSAVQIGRAHV